MLALDRIRNRPATSLWRDMVRLQDEMNSLFSGTRGFSAQPFPTLNLWTAEESAVVTTELPGVEPDSLDISVVGDTLTLRGARNRDELGEGDTYHRRERGSGRFVRSIQLPFRVEPDEVSATFRNGLLNITLPRAHSERPRKIEIKNA